MKLYIPYKILMTFFCIFLLGCPLVNSQKAKKKNSRAYRDSILEHRRNNLDAVYTKLLLNAQVVEPTSESSCQSKEMVKKVDQLLKNDKKIKDTSTINLVSFIDVKEMEPQFFDIDLPNVDKGGFKTKIDMLLSAYTNSANYTDFVSRATGDNLGGLTKVEKKKVKDTYLFFEYLFSNDRMRHMNLEKKIRFDDCMALVYPSIETTTFEYPNITYGLRISVRLNCDCASGKGPLFVDSGSFDYIAISKGIYSGSAITFGDPINPRIVTNTFTCCPEKSELDESASSISTEESDSFIKDTRNIFLNPSSVNEYKEYVTTEWGKEQKEEEPINEDYGYSDSDIFDYTWAGDGFTITAGLGPTTGDEADFFGFSYSGGIGYYQSLTEDFQVGATAGYSRYTGKETDFGFETEGESFIPIMAKARYHISNAFGVEAGLGYAISASEGGEGGLTYSAGPFWKPLEAVLFAINYVNIAFGEGSLGALMLSGSVSLSKK
ncbi:hypothetical protein [uncultured Croceitalea sp.]|uniref:hypothetical protein n=1 Tax=uncultured Croceitalea sp. TaxID=1798908 RepID=UPI0033067102